MTTPLPQPGELTSLVLRTDFSDDEAWREVQAAYGDDHATYVDDPAYDGATIADLVDADGDAGEDDKVFDLFVADATTMTDDEHPLLAIDLADEPGRTFRVRPDLFASVSTNLALANQDFSSFADLADETGTFRGHPGI
ncbi:DUF6924 domain-containing protein [Dactylosporangium sp. NPDC051541]|uniref:DUF6924 domain-containing protein n=1 Tax=Dactylosporangium sp. NPDC051541 TaxID=3363977 RepID=UPI003798A3F9